MSEWWLPTFEKAGGTLPFYDFMKLALYDPEHGYYSQLKAVGAEGDFTTAPELTEIFAEVLASWIKKQWEAMGKPARWGVLEYGAGTGALMRGLRKHVSDAGEVWWGIAEVSATLKGVQASAVGDGVVWVDGIGDVPEGFPLVVLGNEVLDAFPVRQYWLEEDGWRELSLDHALRAQLVPVKPPALPGEWEPELGAIYETAPEAGPWLKDVTAELTRRSGALWLCDYGYVSLPPEGGDTLQALQKHKRVALTHEPGHTDLTAHVNFGQVNMWVGRGEVVDMSLFLLENGLLDLAAKVGGDDAAESAVRRLIHPAEMGALFKVFTANWERGQ